MSTSQATLTALETSNATDELLVLDANGVTPTEALANLETKTEPGGEEVTPDSSLAGLPPDKKVIVLEKMHEANPDDRDIKKQLNQAKRESNKRDREIKGELKDSLKLSGGKLSNKTQQRAVEIYKGELSKKVYTSTVDSAGNVVELDPNISPELQVARRQELIDAGDTDLLPLVNPKAKEALELASVDSAVDSGNLKDLAKTMASSDNKSSLIKRLGEQSGKLLDLGNPITALALGAALGSNKAKNFLPKPVQRMMSRYVKPLSGGSLKRQGMGLIGAAASVDDGWDTVWKQGNRVVNGGSFVGLTGDAAAALGADRRSNHYRATMDALNGYGVTKKGSKAMRDFRKKIKG
tara:strand:- start:16607 stop:17662 length:1056 start_codon:yes stop_codon:yes gene_type:complete